MVMMSMKLKTRLRMVMKLNLGSFEVIKLSFHHYHFPWGLWLDFIKEICLFVFNFSFFPIPSSFFIKKMISLFIINLFDSRFYSFQPFDFEF